ncbi:MAG TPA: hypothetical protein VD997_08255 [Phycisphaerales bacterium]|nr:hypothetical protein [Phycisphaerales bacterium]
MGEGIEEVAAGEGFTHERPEVGVLGWRALVSWPPGGFADFVLMFGIVGFPIIFGRFLAGQSTSLFWAGVVIGAGGVIAGLVLGWRKLRRRMKETPYRGALVSTDDARISLQSPDDAVERAALTMVDDPFEPVVVRTLVDPHFGELEADGKQESLPKHKGIPKVTQHSDRGRAWADLLCMLVAMAAVMVMQRVATGSWWKSVRTDAIWTAIAMAGVMAAFAKPTYVRISPGVLDVVLYPALGAGRPVIERYDLRTSRVVIDAKKGWIAVFDQARASRKAVYLRTRWAITRESVGAWVVRAARSKQPTPPLPMDDLIG